MLNLKNVKQFFKSVGIGLRYRNTLTRVDVLLHVFGSADGGLKLSKTKPKQEGAMLRKRTRGTDAKIHSMS